jgi:hypothetical protein
MFKLTNLKPCSVLARLCWHHGVCCRIRFVSLLLPFTRWLLHTSFMMISMQYTQGFYYSSVWLCSVSSRQSLTLLLLCHVYPTCSPLLPWLHPQAPGPPPLLATTPQFNLANAWPPLDKSTVIKTENIHFIRSRLVMLGSERLGVVGLQKARRPTSWNTTNSLLTPEDPFCIHVFINFVYWLLSHWMTSYSDSPFTD